MTCPACSQPMDEQSFDGNYGRTILLDICHACDGLWFDGQESLQLAPGAILRLFTTIHEKRADHRNQLPDVLSCPRCRDRLVGTTDMQRSTRFSYARCAQGHGRFITFFQFLREKNFVKSLDAKQLNELKQHVKTIACSNCGAPVDLEKASACAYCRAPLSMLDPKQLETTLRELETAEEKRRTIDPTLPARLMMDKLKVESLYARMGSRSLDAGGWGIVGDGLVEMGLGVVVNTLKNALSD